MAPKPAAKAPAKPAAKAAPTPAKKADAPKDAKAGAPGAAEPSGGGGNAAGLNPPKNKEEVLAQVNLDGLPHCPNEQIIEILKERYETLVSVFIHYSKQSECKTIEQATRLRLGAFRRIARTRARASDATAPARSLSHAPPALLHSALIARRRVRWRRRPTERHPLAASWWPCQRKPTLRGHRGGGAGGILVWAVVFWFGRWGGQRMAGSAATTASAVCRLVVASAWQCALVLVRWQ